MSRRADLLAWYRAHRRDLPWRRTRDPYAIWVSEVMLQQTQVAAVLPYFEPFLARFPTPAALAEADEDAVLAAWSGLGYYRRVRHLREGARAVVMRHAGALPRQRDALRALPGIGPYTAGAIASIAFGLEEPVLDGNVRRVLARWTADAGEGGDARFWDLARSLVAGPDPGDWNQALMELGATVCTPQAPRCAECPVSRPCRARATGAPEDFPRPRPRKPSRTVSVEVALIERDGAVLLERKGSGGPLRGKWDLPAVETGGGEALAGEALRAALRARHGIDVVPGTVGRPAVHTILDRRLRLAVVRCTWGQRDVDPGPALRWMAREALDATPVSGATRKVLRANATSAAGGRAL
ncbi:MAG TPA: A/G-specific adenine glycosylase [Candidatus Polarisedimenticolaceae bacterium]|nr:A/G-specific adenine glycosylase [Candidatus Polarisedimenticolaceae bacterium]